MEVSVPKTDSSVRITDAVEEGVTFMPQASRKKQMPVQTTPM